MQHFGTRQETDRRSGGNRTGIPDTMRTRFETISGQSFEDVRVHYNSAKPAQLKALAYTQGDRVYVGPGQERHLPHELGHVVQQRQGRVAATGTVGGLPLNDSPALEREADRMFTAPGTYSPAARPVQRRAVVQRVLTDADPVLYGYHGMRKDYNNNVLKKAADGFRSIDELNAELGLTWREIAKRPLGLRREFLEYTVQKKVVGAADIHQVYAQKWQAWLKAKNRYKILRMDDLDAAQCRNDIGYRAAAAPAVEPAAKYYKGGALAAADPGGGVRVEHYENFLDDDIKYRNDVKGDPVKAVQAKHDTYVESEQQANVGAAALYLKATALDLYRRTVRWQSDPITTKFFRLTSLMGLDFFREQNRDVHFLHAPGFAGDAKMPGDANYNPITNSEWKYYNANRAHFNNVKDTPYDIKKHATMPFAGAGGAAAAAPAAAFAGALVG